MAISEHQRHQLHGRLQETLGVEAADTLMEHLPPVGWADVATKRDIDGLAAAVRADMATMEQRIRADVKAEISSAITSQTRTIMFALVGSNLTIAGIASAAAAFR